MIVLIINQKIVIDPNNKDALLKKDERILELETEVEATKKFSALILYKERSNK